jgi:hypothetical protein
MKKLLIVLACLALVPFAACGLISLSTCGLLSAGKYFNAFDSAAPTPVAAAPLLQPAPEATASPEPTSTEPEPLLSESVSFANFTKDDVLDECTDFAIKITAPEGTDASAKTLARVVDAGAGIVAGLMKDLQKGRNGSPLQRPCAQQFRTNPVLATCNTQNRDPWKNGLVADVEVIARYYDLDVLTKSDSYMKDCLTGKGDWQAVARDSNEYREAEMARARHDLEKLQKRLGR